MVVWGKDSQTVDLHSPAMLSDAWQPCSYCVVEDQWLCTIDHIDSTIKAIELLNKTLWEQVS